MTPTLEAVINFMTNSHFILDFQKQDYPYLEEINEGIVKQIELSNNTSAVLDVGAGRGALGEAIQNRGYTVYAIEACEEAAKEASNRVDHVIHADLHDIEKINASLNGKKFKYIIFSDVLEHVYDPLAVLRSYLPLLDNDGRVLISLPNAVNWLNRLRFLFGNFNYEMTGVMDRTHIRFFTFKSAKKLLLAAECSVEKTDCTPFIVRAFLPLIKKLMLKSSHPRLRGNDTNSQNNTKSILDSPYYKIYEKFVYPVEYWATRICPSLFAFRMIYVVRKK